MPFQITDATIHQLDKSAQSQGDDSVTLNPRNANLAVNDVLQRLCGNLIEMYAKVANSNGTLGVDPVAHKFPVHLQEYSAGTTAFMPFTLAAIKLIAEHMSQAFLANGGYALFLRYVVDGQDFLLVAMLKLKPGAGSRTAVAAEVKILTVSGERCDDAIRDLAYFPARRVRDVNIVRRIYGDSDW